MTGDTQYRAIPCFTGFEQSQVWRHTLKTTRNVFVSRRLCDMGTMYHFGHDTDTAVRQLFSRSWVWGCLVVHCSLTILLGQLLLLLLLLLPSKTERQVGTKMSCCSEKIECLKLSMQRMCIQRLLHEWFLLLRQDWNWCLCLSVAWRANVAPTHSPVACQSWTSYTLCPNCLSCTDTCNLKLPRMLSYSHSQMQACKFGYTLLSKHVSRCFLSSRPENLASNRELDFAEANRYCAPTTYLQQDSILV